MSINHWRSTSEAPPPNGKVVETIISDDDGERNIQPLVRNGNLWFTADGAMYVYYTPTHWREATYQQAMDNAETCAARARSLSR